MGSELLLIGARRKQWNIYFREGKTYFIFMHYIVKQDPKEYMYWKTAVQKCYVWSNIQSIVAAAATTHSSSSQFQ
jgi:hypothetical protein